MLFVMNTQPKVFTGDKEWTSKDTEETKEFLKKVDAGEIKLIELTCSTPDDIKKLLSEI